jgi:hypothetical protein
LKKLETEAQGMRELEVEEVAQVSGAGFLSWLSGVLGSGQPTSIPANSGELGIRG